MAVALFVMGVCAVVITGVALSVDPGGQIGTPASLLLVSALVPLAIRYVSGDVDLFEPVQIISAMIATSFGLRSLYIVWGIDRPMYWLFGRGEYLATVPAALWLALLGYWCLLAGYYGASKLTWFRRNPDRPWPAVLPSSALVTLYVIGVAASAYRVGLSGMVGADPEMLSAVEWNTYGVNALCQGVTFAAVLPFLHRSAGGQARTLDRIIEGLAWVTLLAQSLMFGSKSTLFAPLFACALYHNCYSKRLSFQQVAAIAVPLMFVVLPIVNVYRGDFVSTKPAARTLSEVVSNVMDLPAYLSRYRPGDFLVLGPEMLINRSHGIDSLAALMTDAEQGVDSESPLALIAIPLYAFVPRVFWPSKPAENVAVAFGRAYGVTGEVSASSYTAMGMFNIGDLYSRGRVIGVVTGMMILGLIYRVLYDYVRRWIGPAVLFVYSFVIWQMMNGFEGDIATVYSGVLRSVVPLVGAVLIVQVLSNLRAARPGMPVRPSSSSAARTGA